MGERRWQQGTADEQALLTTQVRSASWPRYPATWPPLRRQVGRQQHQLTTSWVSLIPTCCSILPLESISQTIERNIRELLARNYEVVGLVHQVSLLPQSAAASAPSSAADLAALAGSQGAAEAFVGRTGSGAAAEVAVVDEFGEMTGASGGGSEGVVDAVKGSSGSSNFYQLTASASEAAPAAQARRVQFGGAAVIEMGSGRGSLDGARGGQGTDSPQGSPRVLNRMVSTTPGGPGALPHVPATSAA